MADRDVTGSTPASSGPGKRRGRLWLVVIGATPLLVVAIAAVVYVAGPSEPSVHVVPPAGYQAITDAYYGYAIPAAWTQDSSGTDSNGDFYYRGAGGWIGETLRIRQTAPVLGEPAPPTLASFGQVRATPYQLTDGVPATFPGTDAAWTYFLQRPGRPALRVIDAWVRASHTEIWLVVSAATPQASTIVASLRA